MLKRSKKRQTSRSPNVSREPHRPTISISHTSSANRTPTASTQPYGRTSDTYSAYDTAYPSQNIQMHGHHGSYNNMMHPTINSMAQHYVGQLPPTNFPEAEQFLRGLEQTDVAQLPVWLSDQSLGGQSFSQYGIDAFIIPPELFPPGTTPQIL